MKEIRNLLLDCRAALRKADPDFERTPLRELLDDTIIELRQAEDRRAAPQVAPAATANAQRVAYAWQSAARELRHTQPELFQRLSAKVLERLDADAPADADDEIETLRRRLEERETGLKRVAGELAGLRTALATAVPLADTLGGSESELAQQRLQLLLQAVSQGGGLARPAPASSREDHVPERATLQAVAAGQRALTSTEREWCIGEAMVLTGFQRTPVQLLENGDAALAQLVLDGAPPAG